MTSKRRRGHKKDDGVRCRPVAVLGMRAVHITIEQSMDPQAAISRVGIAAGYMRALRADTVLFSENFPYRDLVLGEGFMEAGERTLIETLAGTIAVRAVIDKKSAALFTDRLTSGTLRTLSELCRSFRTVLLVSGSDADVCRPLGRQLGISVVTNPPARQLYDADAAVFLSAPREKVILSEKTVAIASGRRALDGVSYHAVVQRVQIELINRTVGAIPEDFAFAPIVSAALECMSLDRESIRLSSYDLLRRGDTLRHQMT